MYRFLDKDLEGSAARYIPSDPLAEYLFAIDIYPPGGCATAKGVVSNPQWCIEFNQSSVKAHPVTYLMLGERIYRYREGALVVSIHSSIQMR